LVRGAAVLRLGIVVNIWPAGEVNLDGASSTGFPWFRCKKWRFVPARRASIGAGLAFRSPPSACRATSFCWSSNRSLRPSLR